MPDDADRFRVVLADPPWPFRDRLPGPGRGAAKHYGCLTVAELCAFPLPPLADDCTLFLWRVASMQQEALDVMAAWGFNLKSEIVWLKRTTTGKRWFGMGRTVRAEHETCLIGTRGRPVTRRRNIRSTFEAVGGQHSEKPARFYDFIEALRDGPYVELFARRRRPGWTSLGDQVPARTRNHTCDRWFGPGGVSPDALAVAWGEAE
jgi:N6-adenosine-specific RNA methylase IME4